MHVEGCADGGDFVLVCCDVLHGVLLQQVAIILVHLHSAQAGIDRQAWTTAGMDSGSSRTVGRTDR